MRGGTVPVRQSGISRRTYLADLFIGRPHGGLLVPAAVQLCVHFTRAILFPSNRTSETPPQSGSGRKKQIKSKAAIRNCTHSFAQRVQYRFRRG